jgi:uncharacterized protein (TIGR02001 family)
MGIYCSFTRRFLEVVAVSGAACIFPWIDLVAAADVPPVLQSRSASEVLTQSFDIKFEVALTSDYISRGITNSDNRPAIQGYIEPSFGWAYFNIWATNVDYGAGFSGAEIDVAVGVKPKFDQLSFDLGYVHYFYAPKDVSPDYGELYGTVRYNFRDMFTTIGSVYFAPDYSQSGKTGTYIESGLEIPLSEEFELSGAVGYQFFEDPAAFEQLNWNIGLSYFWESLTLDVRYWDTNLSDGGCVVRSGFSDGCDARIVGTVFIDTAWSALKNLGR